MLAPLLGGWLCWCSSALCAESEFVLPPMRTLLPQTHAPPRILVSKIHFAGNTIFSEAELQDHVKDFVGRRLTQEDLDELRHRITRLYVSGGYVNSGAYLPDQEIDGGEVSIQVVQGTIGKVIAEGNKHLRDRYFFRRLVRNRNEPLHFPTLQKRLQVLQLSPIVSRLNTELKPGPQRGEAFLDLKVEERSPVTFGIEAHNDRPVSVGEGQIDLWMRHLSLIGFGDSLDARVGVASGGRNGVEDDFPNSAYVQYEFPILPDDTSLNIGAEWQDYSIVEEPLSELGIDGENSRIWAGITRPFVRTLKDRLTLSLDLHSIHSETTLSGEPFSIGPGAVNGEADLRVLSLGQEWVHRTENDVFALTSSVSVGLNALDATEFEDEPDAEFIRWRIGGQYLRRIGEHGHVVSLRGLYQGADGPLPPSEQLTLGGADTIRGYSRNTMIRDQGVFASLEYRHSLFRPDDERKWSVEIVPFVDAGWAWDHEEDADSIASVGVGIRATYRSFLRGEVFWGHPLEDFGSSDKDHLQSQGIHVAITLGKF